MVLISLSAVFVRLADVEPARSAFLRAAYALPAFAVLVWWGRRRRRAGPRRPVLVPMALLAGVLLGIDLLTWHESIAIIGAGLATVLPNIQVVFVGILGVLLFKERPHPMFWLALPLNLLGIWLLAAAGKPIEPGASVGLGVLLGVLTAVSYSAFLIVLRSARLRNPDVTATEAMASATLTCAIVAGLYAATQGAAGPAPTLEANLWLVVLALGCQVVGWIMLTSSIAKLPAALTSVALVLQPVLSVIWGVTLLDEPLGPLQLAGAAVVLVGVVLAHRAVVLGTKKAEEAERLAAT